MAIQRPEGLLRRSERDKVGGLLRHSCFSLKRSRRVSTNSSIPPLCLTIPPRQALYQDHKRHFAQSQQTGCDGGASRGGAQSVPHRRVDSVGRHYRGAAVKPNSGAVLSLGQLLEQQPAAPPSCLVEPRVITSAGHSVGGRRTQGG